MNIQRKKRCPWCSTLFDPHPRLKDHQKTCGSGECKRLQNLSAQRRWKKRERETCRQNQKDWRLNHPGYWINWRQRHPDYVVRNRVQSRIRKSFSKLGLQKKLDILQLPETQSNFWNFPRFAKQTRSLIPLLFVYAQHHDRPQSSKESQAP